MQQRRKKPEIPFEKSIMLRTCSIIIAVISFLLSFLFPEKSVGQAIFHGVVINASQDSVAIARLTVYLLQMQSEEGPATEAQTTTSAQGRFQFVIAKADTAATYLAAADYQAVRYYSDGVKFSGSPSSQNASIVVYDTTHTADAIRTMMHHLIIEDAGETIVLRETRILNNSGNKTIMSVMGDSLTGESTFRFSLPFTARNVAPVSSGMGDDLVSLGHFVYDKGVVPPGNRQVSYSYEIPWQRDAATVSIDISQPTRTFDVFISNPQLNFASEQLQDEGPFVIRGVSYRRYGTQNLSAGSQIRFVVSRSSQAKETPMPAILVTAVILLGGLLFALSKTKSGLTEPTNDRAGLIARKNELIQAIAKIDLRSDSRSQAELQRRRKELFEELQSIELKLLEMKPNPKSKKR
jgi:hypothetical protein